jgi:glutathione peroxidase
VTTITDLTVKDIQGNDQSLQDYKGQVLLIVNVASKCGYTPQYRGLEALHEKYKDQGLRVMGFPCNDFGAQEPGSNEEIMQFCTLNYGVEFEMFDKVHAKGPNQSLLYARLTMVPPAGDVAWNFEKFLVNRQGDVVARFPSSVAPDSPELISAIESALGA